MAGQEQVNLPKLSPLKLFAPANMQFATAGGPSEDPRQSGMMFASNQGGDGYDGDDYLDDDPDDYDQQSPTPRRGGGGSGGGGGRQRTVQFEPEERFWTEYLRIALPIIGLLLLIGVFWFWAQALIDDGDNGETPESTQTPVAQVNPTSAPTQSAEPTTAPTEETQPTDEPEPTAEADGGDEETPAADDGEAAEDAAADDGEEAPTDDGEATDDEASADDGASSDAAFASGDIAYVSDTDVRVRSEPGTGGGDETIVDTVGIDTEVTITGDPEEDDEGNLWYPVSYDNDTGDEQWIREDFLSPDPSE